MKYNKFGKFLTHDVTLLVISFFLAFIILFFINYTSTTETNITISDLPINIELSEEAKENGLQVFSGNDVKGSVEVSGNRATIASLTSSDIQIVSTNAGNISEAGNYQMYLTAKKVGTKSNYNIVTSTLTPSTITVYVDKLKEQEYDIENQLSFEVPDGKYANATLGTTKVTLSGPNRIISTISKVAIQGTIDHTITSGDTFEANLVYLDDEQNVVTSPLITADFETVTVTFTLMEKQNVNLKLNIENGPANDPKISLSPVSISIAASESGLKNISNGILNIASYDFSTVENKSYNEEIEMEFPEGITNLSDYKTVKAKFDFSNYDTRTLTCSIVSNLDSNEYKLDLTSKSVEIKVVGPASDISKIKASDVTAALDFTGLLEDVSDKTVTLDVPIKCSLGSDYGDVWVYGTYNISANITKVTA